MIRLSPRAWVILGTVIAVIAAADLAWGGYRFATGSDTGISLMITGLALTGVAVVFWYCGARARRSR